VVNIHEFHHCLSLYLFLAQLAFEPRCCSSTRLSIPTCSLEVPPCCPEVPYCCPAVPAWALTLVMQVYGVDREWVCQFLIWELSAVHLVEILTYVNIYVSYWSSGSKGQFIAEEQVDDNDDDWWWWWWWWWWWLFYCRRTCVKLPLPDADRPSIDFVIMMIDLSNRERLLACLLACLLTYLLTNYSTREEMSLLCWWVCLSVNKVSQKDVDN